MRILLINPPWYSLFGQRHHGFHLGLGYLAAAARAAGHEAWILDGDAVSEGALRTDQDTVARHETYLRRLNDAADPAWERIRREVLAQQPDVVCVTAMTATMKSALMTAQVVKATKPDTVVLAGGVHATLCPEDFAASPHVDCTVRGEGEDALLTLFKFLGPIKGSALNNPAGAEPAPAPGLATAAPAAAEPAAGALPSGDAPEPPMRGAILPRIYPPLSKNCGLMPDLDRIPVPAREAIIDVQQLPPLALGHIFASRGCPFQCCFCASHKVWTHKVRYRSLDNVVAEMADVRQKYGTRYFYFEDDSFTLQKSRIEAFCALLREARLGVTWGCETRVDLVDEALLGTMKAAGCRFISLGAEAGSDKSLELIGKKITTAQVRAAVRLAKRHGLETNLFFMIGFPWEEEADIRQTVEFFRELAPTFGVLSIATPYPGTMLFDLCRAEGLVPEKPDWSQFYHQSPHVFFNRRVPGERARELIRWAQGVFDERNRSSKRRQLLRPGYVLERVIQNRYYRPGLAWQALKALVGRSKPG